MAIRPTRRRRRPGRCSPPARSGSISRTRAATGGSSPSRPRWPASAPPPSRVSYATAAPTRRSGKVPFRTRRCSRSSNDGLSIGGAFRYAERVKLATYASRGKISYGAVVGDAIVDLGDSRYPTLKSVLAAGALDELRKAARGKRPDHRLADVELRPVIPDPAKILCVGLNYHAHRDETGHRDPTAHPALFIRYADTQVGDGQPLVLPRNAKDSDYEAERAVVVGKRARQVPAARALEYVAGYSCYHDGSLRDWQFHTSQWTPGKNFPATSGFGPWLVTTD